MMHMMPRMSMDSAQSIPETAMRDGSQFVTGTFHFLQNMEILSNPLIVKKRPIPKRITPMMIFANFKYNSLFPFLGVFSAQSLHVRLRVVSFRRLFFCRAGNNKICSYLDLNLSSGYSRSSSIIE